MLLSIVIPTRNRPELLSKCLESLASEGLDRTDTEVIVVDDASESGAAEKTRVLCESRGARRIRLEKRTGASFARNCGINASSGEWIAFLDDDVRVAAGWYSHLRDLLGTTAAEIAGIEGRVIAEGDGLWDREVQNETGGLYLTCHIVYRASVLKRIAGFDEHFNAQIPSCEDHELASRILRWGPVVYHHSLAVMHASRRVNSLRYLLASPMRIRSQLESEYYFYSKQKDMYHLFRHCTTFFGTYRAILLKHAWTSLHRRPANLFARHPVQSAVLQCSCIVEQAFAWILLPVFLVRYCTKALTFFNDGVDPVLTARFWGFAHAMPSHTYRASSNLFRAVMFSVTRKPVYSIVPFLNRRVRSNQASSIARCFLRIDDVFLDNKEAVERMCEITSRKGIPYLAAVIGSHITDERYSSTLKAVRQSGADIGLHGFVHEGNFGPYNSEILQLPFPRLSTSVEKVLAVFPESARPFVFVPPFNAINRDQILFLGKYFKVICGGPETARFTDKTIGPVALLNGSWYFPAFHPFYQGSSAILRSRALDRYGPLGCNICFSVHMPDEAKDRFRDFSALIDHIADTLTSWEIFKQGSFADLRYGVV
jgi:glycosyltransferase involved in cell wall biosynthesis